MTIALACLTCAFATLAACAVVYAHAAKAAADAAASEAARRDARNAATIDMLCQRIQAPESAAVLHELDHADQSMPQPPAMDDDKAMWEAMQENRQQFSQQFQPPDEAA